MNIQDYIASGILENYVLGLLSENEERQVIENLSKYPELKEETYLIEDTLQRYALAHKKTVPVNLEAAILNKINQQKTTNPTQATSTTKPTASSNRISLPIVGLLLLSSLLLGYLAFNNYQKNQQIDQQQKNYQTLESDCQTKDHSIHRLQEEIRILRENDNIYIKMKGTDKAPQAIANIIYNAEKETAYIDIQSLPTPPSDKQYQLWAIVDGNPVDMGVFDVILDPDTTLQAVPFIKTPQAFAVTLEAKGGNPTPTLEEMFVIGYTSS